MKKLFIILLIIIITMAFIGAVFAAEQAQLTYGASPMGKVTFNHTSHGGGKYKCNDCHGKFGFISADAAKKVEKETGRPTKIKMADNLAGKYCGGCHNGKTAFAPPPNNCTKCHKLK